MARKSNETLWNEKLTEISDCPHDLCSTLGYDFMLLSTVKDSEEGSLDATLRLIDRLYNTHISFSEPNNALLYFLNKGILLGELSAATRAIDYILSIDFGYDILDSATELINRCAAKALIDEYTQKIIDCQVMRAVYEAKDGMADTKLISKLPRDEYIFEKIYVLATAKEHYSDISLDELVKSVGLEHLFELDSFGGMISTHYSLSPDLDSVLNSLKLALMSQKNSYYRDFWLRCLYEFTVKYIPEKLPFIAEDVISVAKGRSNSAHGCLHAAAWMHYLLENSSDADRERLMTALKETGDLLSFDGDMQNLDDPSVRDELMRAAVYTRTEDCIKEAATASVLGNIIHHTKNRYTLKCSLNGHSKRGCKHSWETTLSFKPNEYIETPIFGGFSITDVRTSVSRCGITLPENRHQSQIICLGEVSGGKNRSPFVLDLILDIAYISAVKCEALDIKVKNVCKNGDYITMKCKVFLY